MPAKARRRQVSVPPAAPPVEPSKLELFGRGYLAFAAASVAVLIPCFWQSRLQAGDLSSHIYNAWLARLIQEGRAPGLVIAHQTTNILFDWMLSAWMQAAGVAAAQRISVAIAVLAFVWGSFAFVSAVAGNRAWRMLPLITVLAYGFVFHIGFFNFYLSLGLCFGAMALCWQGRLRHCLAAVPLLCLAYVAHALPVVWACGLLGYLWVARRLMPRHRASLPWATGAALVLIDVVVHARVLARWFPTQILSATGLDQVWIFDSKYLCVSVAMMALFALLALALMRHSGWNKVLDSVPFHYCALTAFAILIFPTTVLIPGYKHTLTYIADRMGLALSICICALLATAPQQTFHRYFQGILTAVFLVFLFRDEHVLNAFEDRIDRVVATLPPYQRVINAIDASDLRINGLGHMIDRACIGHCFSYANYEPSTAQFRVRVSGANPVVAPTYVDSWAMQTGLYVVKPNDVPLYVVNFDSNGEVVVTALPAGVRCGITEWNPLSML